MPGSTWPRRILRRICTIRYGDSLSAEERVDGDVRVYGSNGSVGIHNAANTSAPVIVIGRKGSHGQLQYSSVRVFAIDTTFFVDSGSSGCHLRWLYYAMSTLGLHELTSDVGVPGLSRELAYEQTVPLPPQEAQRAIADFLDAETARIDALIAKKRAMVDLLEQRWLAAITTAAAPAARPEDPALRRAVESSIGGSWGSDPGQEEEALCIRGTDFDTRALGVKVSAAPTRSFSKAELRSRELKAGDLLIEKSGGGEAQPVGRVVQWFADERAVPTNFAARLRPSRHVHSRYLAYAFRSAYEAGMTRAWIRQTTGIQNLDLGGLLSEKWTFPDLSTQREIAERLDRVAHDVHAVQDLLNRQIGLLYERRQALITAAVTGELDIPGLAA